MKKINFVFVIVLVLIVATGVISAETIPACKEIGTTCTPFTGEGTCCPTYLTEYGFFQGYCEQIDPQFGTGSCQPADGLEGRISPKELCKMVFNIDGSPNPLKSELYEYYYLGNLCNSDPSSCGKWVDNGLDKNFMGFDIQEAKKVMLSQTFFHSYPSYHVCDIVFSGDGETVEPLYLHKQSDSGFMYHSGNAYSKVSVPVDEWGYIREDYDKTTFDIFGLNKAPYKTNSVVSGEELTSFDPAGNVLQKTLANGIIINNEYDGLYRLRKTTSKKPTGELTGEEDDQPGQMIYNEEVILYNYPKDSSEGCSTLFSPFRLCSIEDSSGKTEFFYDSRGQVRRMTKTIIDSDISPRVYVLDYTYNNDGSLKTMTMPDKGILSYFYDGLGRLDKINYEEEGVVEEITDLSYNPTGTINQKVLNPGSPEEKIIADYEYNQRDLIKTMEYTNHEGSLFERGFTYDPIGNVKEISYNIRDLVGNEVYTYDALNRLTEAKYFQDKRDQTVFEYGYKNLLGDRDSLGIIAPDSTTLSTENIDYSYDGFQVLSTNGVNSQTSYSYDEVGNVELISEPDKQTVLIYDPFDRVSKAIVNGVETEYSYDYTNKRIKKKTPSETTFYLYQGNNVIYEETIQAGEEPEDPNEKNCENTLEGKCSGMYYCDNGNLDYNCQKCCKSPLQCKENIKTKVLECIASVSPDPTASKKLEDPVSRPDGLGGVDESEGLPNTLSRAIFGALKRLFRGG